MAQAEAEGEVERRASELSASWVGEDGAKDRRILELERRVTALQAELQAGNGGKRGMGSMGSPGQYSIAPGIFFLCVLLFVLVLFVVAERQTTV